MPILNYTTSIAAQKSINEIQQKLAKAGASAVMSEFDDTGNIVALSFKMRIEPGSGQEIVFRLPTNWRPVLKVLEQQRYRNSRVKATEDQARRVAWRITKDWVEAQLAIIETRMVTLPQVFLPYAVTSKGTSLYQEIAENPQLLLSDGN